MGRLTFGILWVVALGVAGVGSARGACPAGDVSGDCKLDWTDIQVLSAHWLDSPADIGDINSDNVVDGRDYALVAESWRIEPPANIVINEIHYNPDVKNDLVEFVELYNPGAVDVNISGWYFRDGISYVFEPNTVLAANSYLIVCQNLDAMRNRFWDSWPRGMPWNLIHGPYDGSLNNDGEQVELCDAHGQLVDRVDYKLGFPWPTVGDAPGGTMSGRGSSIQLTDPSFDNDLGGSWRSAYPTPARANTAVLTANLPPHIRQVSHDPKQPRSGELVTITAKVTDDDGVASVTLYYQIVNPGSYISINHSEYYSNWTTMTMRDDGLAGDRIAGDGIYTARLPGSIQTHRRLIRYKIHVADTVGVSQVVPYPDDPQPNFAYFVYDGVPAWRGSIRPGSQPEIDYPVEVMRSLPVYHLLSTKQNIESSTWLQKYRGSDYLWFGTFVYDGDVYDHVRFRARGGVWRYSMGKNMWKFDFNRGHYFQARDNYGRPYGTTWDKLNFSACIQQGSFGQRGEQGMVEALTFRMFELAGVPAPKTHYIHFRIIDEANEDGRLNAAHSPITTSGTQFDGDFWGLYLVLEQMDGRFLDEHGLADGNLYKMDPGADDAGPGGGALNNQGPTQPSDHSDLVALLAGNPTGQAAWWGQTVELDRYYSHRAVQHASHHGDITEKNYFLYHCPEPTTNEWGTFERWSLLPWDVDLTWTTYYRPENMTDLFYNRGILGFSEFAIAARNRVREFSDLLFNIEQMTQLIDEYAAIINDPSGGLSVVDADRAMWDYHWVVGDAAYPTYIDQPASNKAGQGRFYEEAQDQGYSRSFENMVQVLKDYMTSMFTQSPSGQGYNGRFAYMASLAQDSAIPNTPTITATGPAGFPINALTFQSSAFGDPQGSGTFGAIKWRIAEVAAGSVWIPPDNDVVYFDYASRWKYFPGSQEATSPDITLWREPGFNDAAWSEGAAPIGWGEPASFLNTTLTVPTNTRCIFLRRKFTVENPDRLEKVRLEIVYDDGFNVWINDRHVHRENIATDSPTISDRASGGHVPEKTPVTFDLPEPSDYLVAGENVIAIQVHNYSTTGGDCFIDARLVGMLKSQGGGDPEPVRTEGKYEITAVWESPQIYPLNRDITIPARGLETGRTYRVRCRMKDNTGRWSHWSAPIQFVVGPPVPSPIAQNLRVTEIMYNPAAGPIGDTNDNNEYEFIEIKNIGAQTLDLTHVSFTEGIRFDFADSHITSLAPGQFALVVRNEQAFTSRYGPQAAAQVAGTYLGSLDNAGEQIRLDDYYQGTILDFEYEDGWYANTDGDGFSLTIRDAAAADPNLWSSKDGWRPSVLFGGSPGADDAGSLPLPGSVVINEVLAHSHMEASDWIELHNTTAEPVNIGGWFLSDNDSTDASRRKYRIADGTTIDPYGYIVFYENLHFGNPADPGALVRFALSENGEEVVLNSATGNTLTGYRNYEDFGASPTGVAFGRHIKGDGSNNFVLMSQNTPGQANAYPLVGPVVINEIMYNPPSGNQNEEYIELLNITDAPVTLIDPLTGVPWRFTDGIECVFPTSPPLTVPAGGRVMVVRSLVDFTARYGAIPPGVPILEFDSGALDNAGEKLEISMGGDVDSQGVRYYIRVDRVNYSDGSHPVGADLWPPAADGAGKSLTRVNPLAYGNDVINWTAADPTPGY